MRPPVSLGVVPDGARSVRTRIVPTWRPTVLVRRLVVLAAALLATLAVLPGPVATVCFSATIVVLLRVLADERPESLLVEVVPQTDRAVAGQDIGYLVRLVEPLPSGATCAVRLEPAPGIGRVGGQPWLLTGEMALRVRTTRWLRASPGTLLFTATTRVGGWSTRARVALPELIVHPRTATVAQVGAPPQLLSRLGMHGSRTRGTGTDFADIRAYVPGDLIRDVNWKASARTRELMVSRRYTDQSADVVMLVDHTSAKGAYDRTALDRAVSGAVSVASKHLAAGDRVGLLLYGSTIRWIAPAQGRAQRMRLLDEMVQSPRAVSEVDPDVLRIPAAALPPSAVVVCFSTLLDLRMVSAVALLARRGHRILVVDTAGVEPDSWPKGILPETKVAWRAERAGLRSRLAAVGVVVVDDADQVAFGTKMFAQQAVAL